MSSKIVIKNKKRERVKFMKKKLLLMMGLMAVCSTAFAGNFSFTNEIKMNDETNYRPDGRKKVEWTLGRGSYKMDNGLNFKFDVDRDFVTYQNKPGGSYEGWDTYAALYYPVTSFEIAGFTFNNQVGAELYWDDSTTTEETEIGLAWQTSTKLDKTTSLSMKFWGRNINIESGSSDETDMVYGIETSLGKKINGNWSASASVNTLWGGYNDGGSTFYNGRDDFNYEVFTYLNYDKDLYKLNDNFKIYFATDFGVEWYGQGDDFKGTSNKYTKTYVRPELGFEYKVNDSAKLYASTRYSILGQYAFDNDTTRDANEWEAIAGFSFKY